MNQIKLVAFALVVALGAVPALAESPTEIATRLIVKMQQQRSVEAVVEDIDWSGAYEAMDPEMKAQMGIKSPEDLKAQQVDNYKGAGNKAQARLRDLVRTADEAKAPVLKIMNERLEKSLREQKENENKAFAETEYSLGKTTMGETEAQVEVIKKRGEKESSSTLEFVKVSGNWKLKSAAPLSPTASADGPPPGPNDILGPSVSAPDEALIRFY